jgi:3'(2'), 5'-bisphosphate nucleotidase
MAGFDHERLLNALLPFVLRAAEAIMQHRAAGVSAEWKRDGSPVSAADREAESILVEGLGRTAPDIPVVAEESSGAAAPAACGPLFFLVDPLDGTRDYLAGGDEFTINVGLIENRMPVFGIVYAPAIGRLFATRASGHAIEVRVEPATRPGEVNALGARPLVTRLPGPANLRAVASRSHRHPGLANVLSALGIGPARPVGSSLKFGLLAAGEADVYPRIGQTSAWDTAAGHAVLLSAGGLVTKLNGEPLQYPDREADWNNPPFIAWARPELARRL